MKPLLSIRYRIHNTPFHSQLTNRPNELGCYITQDWKGVPVKNALAYRNQS